MYLFKNINKNYNSRLVLKNISLKVDAGETVVVLGKNGAGKSTLMKILGGSLRSDTKLDTEKNSQSIKYNSPSSARKYGITSIYQGASFVDCMSIWRNFFLFREKLLGGVFLRISKMKKIVSEEMGKIGIDLDPENAVSTLSGGEKQCLSIVSVIYHRAELLLLDEPTSALEKKQKLNLIKFLKDAQKTHPISIIIVTHSFEEAYYMGDRIIVLRGADLLPIEKQQLIQRERLISKDFYV